MAFECKSHSGYHAIDILRTWSVHRQTNNKDQVASYSTRRYIHKQVTLFKKGSKVLAIIGSSLNRQHWQRDFHHYIQVHRDRF